MNARLNYLPNSWEQNFNLQKYLRNDFFIMSISLKYFMFIPQGVKVAFNSFFQRVTQFVKPSYETQCVFIDNHTFFSDL